MAFKINLLQMRFADSWMRMKREYELCVESVDVYEVK